MDWSKAYEVFKITGSIVLTMGGIVGTIYGFITYNKKYRAWKKDRMERQEKLDALLNSPMVSNCASCSLGELREQVGETSKSVKELAKTTEAIITHNLLQDEEIEKSRRQREVHDIALFALVEAAKEDGKDGAITTAHQAMTEYLRSEALKPVIQHEN